MRLYLETIKKCHNCACAPKCPPKRSEGGSASAHRCAGTVDASNLNSEEGFRWWLLIYHERCVTGFDHIIEIKLAHVHAALRKQN